MHRYLRAIGFRNTINRERELQILLDNLGHTADSRELYRTMENQPGMMEISKSFGPGIGIKVCGEADGDGFHRTHYFPYFVGSQQTLCEEISVDERSAGDGFAGMVEEDRMGATIIFYLQNTADYMKSRTGKKSVDPRLPVSLSALSTDGVILLPSKPVRESYIEERRNYYQRHESLMSAARNGSQDAIESLTMEDMDTYAMLARRIQYEDVYSIVDTSFMPYGMECDQYQIIGTIQFCITVQNSYTKEQVCQLTVESNGLLLDICINREDLLGEPQPGRRFKGTVWLQGRVL